MSKAFPLPLRMIGPGSQPEDVDCSVSRCRRE